MLSEVDLSLTLDLVNYNRLLKRYQAELMGFSRQVYNQKRPVIIVFEGCQVSGKSGVIRSVTAGLDARSFIAHAVMSPAGDEANRHYMWRFWRRLPEAGRIAIFDRSWYGRVIDERLGGRCPEEACKRAYREINKFERQLLDFGTLIFKFWLHTDRRQPASRLDSLSADQARKYPKRADDWCSHNNWDLYEDAANEMLLKTSTTNAPWTVVECNSEYYAQIKTLKTLVVGLKIAFPEPSNKMLKSLDSNKKKKGKRKGKKK